MSHISLSVACPHCKSEANIPCVILRGKYKGTFYSANKVHGARKEAYDLAQQQPQLPLTAELVKSAQPTETIHVCEIEGVDGLIVLHTKAVSYQHILTSTDKAVLVVGPTNATAWIPKSVILQATILEGTPTLIIKHHVKVQWFYED